VADPREICDYEATGVGSRDPFERITKSGALERATMLPLSLLHDFQQAQPTPLALGRDLLRLPSQVCAGSISMLRVSARVPDNDGTRGCLRVIRSQLIRGRSGQAAIDGRNYR